MGSVVRTRDADDGRQMRDERPRLHRALRGDVCLPDRDILVARVEHGTDDVGSVEALAEARGGEEVGRLVPTAVDVPADQIFAAGRGHVVAGWRPGDPAPVLGMDEEGEQLHETSSIQTRHTSARLSCSACARALGS